MCGIVGYIGKNQAVPYLLQGLEKLEYRGYDSSGIAVLEEGKIKTLKSAGRLACLKEKLNRNGQPKGNVGIGHTRWATHGKPNDLNSHPHSSESGKFALVHNGIIENYREIKTKLENEGITFVSETDTETAVKLLEKNFHGDVLTALSKTISELEGSFAFAVLFEAEEKIFCARRSSPLVLGKGEDGFFASSDVTAMLKYTRDIYTLDDDEIAVLSKDEVKFYDRAAKEIQKQSEKVTIGIEEAEKGGFEDFMLKEIFEQPTAVSRTVFPRIKNESEINLGELKLTKAEIEKIDKIFITSCGSAFHVGVTAKYIFEKLTRISTEVEIASEFRYRDPILSENALVIIISQSGETADSLAALRLAKEKGAKTLAVVNVLGSTIANESENVLYTFAGPEIAVATTKAYSAQLSLMYLLAIYFGKILGKIKASEEKEFVSALKDLPNKIETTIQTQNEKMKSLAEVFAKTEHAYFIGRNSDYASSLEASLKMKEISYIHSEAYGAGELKHGTISLIEKGTMVVSLCAQDGIFKKTISNIKEVKARGATVLAVTTKKHKDEIPDADYLITVPNCKAEFLPSLEILPLQLLSYYTAKKRGADADKPRNLAKSVTVE